jgi:hypothetical protein
MSNLTPANVPVPAPAPVPTQQTRQPSLFSNLFQSVKTNVGNELQSQIDQTGRDIKGHALGLVDEAKGQAFGLLTDAKNRAIQQAQMTLMRSIPGLTPAQAQQLQSKLQTALPKALSEGVAPADAIVAAEAAVLQDAVNTGIVTENQAALAVQNATQQTVPPLLPPRDDTIIGKQFGPEFQCLPFVLPSNPSDGAICRSKGFDGYRDASGKCDNDPEHHNNCTMLGCTGWHPGKGNCFIAPGVAPSLSTEGVQLGGGYSLMKNNRQRRTSFGGDSPLRTLRQCINLTF